jgi:YVTN family beta-propeller protein
MRQFSAGRWVRAFALTAAAAVLAACGQGGDAPTDAAPDAASGAAPTDQSGQVASKAVRDERAQVGGLWAAPFDMSVIAIHMALQPGGRVLYYGSDLNGAQTASKQYAVWDPAAGTDADSVMVLPNKDGTDIFCSSQTLMPDGTTLIAGGDMPGGGITPNGDSNLFDASTNSLAKRTPMNRARWYSTTTTLMNGEVYIQGGSGGQDRPEIRRADGSFDLLENADTTGIAWSFPRNWVAPDGRVFGIDASGRMYYVDTSGEGALVRAGQLPSRSAVGSAGAAMFRPGRILGLSSQSPAVTVVDIRSGAPAVSNTEALSGRRIHGVATVLADGRVLASGGGTLDNQLDAAIRSAEVWNPVTGEWTIGPSQVNARLYHGTALLLPDARVLVAGGGAPGPLANRNGEIYSPSYLFDATGMPARRPAITAAPDTLQPGRSFALRVGAGAVSRVTLVRFGSVSHSWNSDQRFLDLPFRATEASGATVAVQLPSRATDTPPGFYLLFAWDANGVPSVARTLRITEPGNPGVVDAPTVDAIADRDWTTGDVVLQPAGRSPRGTPIAWSASGLPDGLSIDRTSGAITGRPTRTGQHFVTVAADDGTWTGTRSFLWTVTPSQAKLEQPESGGPVAAGVGTSFTARTTGTGLTYEWRFGDGTQPTARSSSPSVNHVFAGPGVYTVTVTVYDAQGRPVTGSFLQVVHGATGPQSARSSMIVLSGTGAAQRLWVANPDANTVAVFDAASRTRLAEISVGEQPVTLTVAGDGRVWVANRRSASLSVIDPVTRAVVRTIALPPGSQPYGVVAAPAGGTVWVVMEGTGALYRYDATSFAQTGTAAVGATARHLAISGDGATVYATRFITPPLPGESTAKVDPYAGGRVHGARVIPVDAVTMAVGTQIVLRHSDRPDAENQGRGIPNYLGAMAISPDASQAFVPSKQDNVLRGTLRDPGRDLDFQNTVRAVSSRIVMATGAEDPAARIDHDNASLASAATFDPLGTLLFVALETSREVAVIDAYSRAQLMRVQVGRAPQGLQVSPDGSRLYVANFMDRTVTVLDLVPLRTRGRFEVPVLGTLPTVGAEPLSAQVLLGKQLFYDAADTRLARDRYMSCASCHNDGGHDGRTWDLTGTGEGLRNTISLRGRGGMRHGMLHWSGNFDEVQDFEGQIRRLAGGTGLMSDADFAVGTRSQPIGTPKAGVSADLDALAAYVGSLTAVERSPYRAASGVPSAAEALGREVFAERCASCHAGPAVTDSAPGGRHAVGTLKAASGKRLGGLLGGIDTPSLSDVWATAPYLHDGSAATLEAAISAHVPGLADGDLAEVATFVRNGAVDTVSPPRRLEGAAVRAVGSAVARPDGSTRLTSTFNQAGALWSTQAWPTAQPFTTAFDFSMDGTGRQADGLAFVLHGSGPGAIGGAGGCIGVCGLSNVIAAAVRTWVVNDGGFILDGRPGRPLGFDAGAARRIVGRMSVTWNPASNRLSMTASILVDGVARSIADSISVDLRTRFGATVTAGITAGTGGATAIQTVSNWSTAPIVPAPRRDDSSTDFGGIAIGAPECVSWAEGREDCFVVGTDGALYHRFKPPGGAWTPRWARQGGTLAEGRPSCVSVGANRLDCFAIGRDRALWQRSWDGARWLDWRSLGGATSSDPSCVAGPLGRIDCVVRGPENALFSRTFAGGAWGAWRSLGGVLTSAPDCVLDAQGATQCFARGTDAALWQKALEPGGSWRSLGGSIHGESSCATQADGLMRCYVRGSDDALWGNAFDGVRWSGWRQERASIGLVQAPPRCVASPERNGVDCFVVTRDGTLRHRVRDGGGPDDGAWPWTVTATGLAPEAPGCIAQRGTVSCTARVAADRRVVNESWTVD